MTQHQILSDHDRFPEEPGATLIRNQCAFTSRDMSMHWADAFTYGIVLGWDAAADDPEPEDAMSEIAAAHGWDEQMIAFVRDAHERFLALRETGADT